MSLFSFIKREPKDDKLRKYINSNFEIILLLKWVEYVDDSIKEGEIFPVCFYNSKFQNGALQIWTFTFEEKAHFSKAALKRIAVDQLKIKMKVNKMLNKEIVQYNRDDHFFAESIYKGKKWFTRLWTVITPRKMAHISYNSKLINPDVDQKEVTQIVDSFRFVEK